ncbi:glycosyltransferase [Bifidobacterium gallicum]|uniref:Glycosyl transferase n=1 Tax=Bifidobacterium gallicum DSM 20093 = LMG 11596 TaxID=561180 RepID=D1NV22_9BIFI|nr:glycosyltransferase family 2 protein [Bifidobacterium gallicum]EFA22673.1 glycosyltransferase, group 2 family protein [Bifidobacterium gallicum DSM 20093 = LMG 11596]KFI59634.1 glycosyl transferase [Bifidobacterium gallicum DSM 20093 = LMG 11596]
MLNVSIVIPAWNEEERIIDCLTNATRQTVMPHEVIVVDNRSTDRTVELVEQFIAEHPQAPVKIMHQDEEQALIPTRNYGLNHATGDVLGRIDADCMLKPDWVEIVAGVFTEDPEAMGATGPVTYYDMPARRISLRGDNRVRRHSYRADGGQVLLFGSNMALRASAWHTIADEVCLDREDKMHEDIDISLHLLGRGMKTVYSQRMVCGISARRMDTTFKSFRNYMQRFKNTFQAHPEHWRRHKSEHTLYLMYPWLHALYPIYQQYLEAKDINPALRVWLKEQVELAHKDGDLIDLPEVESVDDLEPVGTAQHLAANGTLPFEDLPEPEEVH